MITAGDLQPELLSRRVEDAVDVSGALDNCFFHSYAAYVLANKLPLPADLFTPNPERRGSPAEQLKETFKGPEDLEIFNAHHQQRYPDAEASEMLVEKTLVLGVLYREWFADQLLKNETHKEQLFSNSDDKISFLKMIETCRAGDSEILLMDGRTAPIYEANRDFFDSLKDHPFPMSEADAREYWVHQGYQNYCNYIAKPGVKLSHTDFTPVLDTQNVPYTLYSKQNSSVIKHNAGNPEQPRFELALAEAQGHYFLLKDSKTAASLDDYAASMAQYKEDRGAILSMEGTPEDKHKACGNMSSQLVEAIFPKDTVPGEPVRSLIETVAEIKLKVSQETLHVEDLHNRLTTKEQQVLQATTARNPHVDADKFQSYKKEIQKLISTGRKGNFSTDADNAILPEDIEGAGAREGETDDDFAKRLQDAEFRGAGLK